MSNWTDKIAGFHNDVIVIICDIPGTEMIKEIKKEVKSKNLEFVAKHNMVFIMSDFNEDLKKFTRDYLISNIIKNEH